MQLIILSTIEKKGQSHGYEIIQEIFRQSSDLEIFTGGRKGNVEATKGIKLKEGSIYPYLNRLDADGFLKSQWIRNKKVYELTSDGRLLLEKIKALHRDFNDVVKKFI